MTRFPALLALVTSSLVASGCGGGGGGSTPNTAPVASVVASPGSGLPNLVVSLDASASRDPDGQITSYAWNFGDGSPAGAGVTAVHTYRQVGQYTVTLTVRDNAGATSAATAVIIVRPLTAATRYSVKFLPTPDGSPGYMAPYAINESGQVAGTLDVLLDNRFSTRAFFHDGTMTRALGTLGGADGEGFDVNAAGMVVGFSFDGAGTQRAFAYSQGALVDLGALPGASVAAAFAVNDLGQAAGGALDANGNVRAVLFDNGTVRDLGTLGGASSLAVGINSVGEIVGGAFTAAGRQHAFRYRDSQMEDLGTLGGENSFAVAVNDPGQVLAWSEANFDDGTPGYPYQVGVVFQNGTRTEIRPTRGQDVLPRAINNLGQVVGVIGESDDYDDYAFVWHPSNGIRNLTDLIDPTVECDITTAEDINGRGQILAVASCESDKYPWGDSMVPVVLTPES